MKLLLTICSLWRKLREWGVMGVASFFFNRARNLYLKIWFLHNAWQHGNFTPEYGITIVAPMRGKSSLSKVMRDFAFSLREANVPFQVFDLSRRSEIPEADVISILTPRSDFVANKYSVAIDMVSSPFPRLSNVRRAHIAFWEFESGFVEIYPELLTDEEVVGMSDFNARYFRRALPNSTPVGKILYPFQLPTCELEDPIVVRRRIGIPADAFAVFFNFDFGSSASRKNPNGVVRAFSMAFANDSKSFLVLKTIHSAEFPAAVAQIESLSRELGVSDRLIMVNEYLPVDGLYSLVNACDVYVSLHRGEGFGLGIAEAMSLGKPVVVTDYSATTEFCTSTNSFPIPYKLVPIQQELADHMYLAHVERWADADVSAAAEALVKCRKSPELCSKIGHEAQLTMHEMFSNRNFRQSVDSFIKGSVLS